MSPLLLVPWCSVLPALISLLFAFMGLMAHPENLDIPSELCPNGLCFVSQRYSFLCGWLPCSSEFHLSLDFLCLGPTHLLGLVAPFRRAPDAVCIFWFTCDQFFSDMLFSLAIPRNSPGPPSGFCLPQIRGQFLDFHSPQDSSSLVWISTHGKPKHCLKYNK